MKIAEIEKLPPQEKLLLIKTALDILQGLDLLYKQNLRLNSDLLDPRTVMDITNLQGTLLGIKNRYISMRDQNRKQVNPSVVMKDIKTYRFGDYTLTDEETDEQIYLLLTDSKDNLF